MQKGDVMGHGFMGEVAETGDGILRPAARRTGSYGRKTFKMIIKSELVGCGCRSELTATITTVVSR
jgi:hypothetical protein